MDEFQRNYRNDKNNIIAQSACCNQTLGDVLVDRQTRFTSTHVFNTKVWWILIRWFDWLNEYFVQISVEGRPVTNQKASGRCWIFACLNVMRIQLMKSLKVSDLELSQNYLFYYDKVCYWWKQNKTKQFSSQIDRTLSLFSYFNNRFS